MNRNQSKNVAILALATTLVLGVSNHLANAQQFITNPKVQGFPWKIGETWKYSQDLHGSINNGLDFGTPNGGVGNVYSVDSGKVYWISQDRCTIIIKGSSSNAGLYHGYHHLKLDPSISPGNSVSYQDKLGTTALCGGSNAHHIHFWLYDDKTKISGNTDNKTGQKDFNPIGTFFGNWQLTKERDSSETLRSGFDPVSGYDYVLRNGKTVACAGSTIQNSKNICTTNKLTNANTGSTNPPPSNDTSFVSPSSSLSISPSSLNLTVSDSNLKGKTVYVRTWRPAVDRYGEKEFQQQQSTATSNTVTVYDLVEGSTLSGVTYYTVASLSPIPSGEAARQAQEQIKTGRSGCYAATGGKYLCDSRRR